MPTQCLEQGSVILSPELKKDLAWFYRFLPTSQGIFIIHTDGRIPVQLYINACTSRCGAITAGSVYHTTFPPRVLMDNPPYVTLRLTMPLWPSSCGLPNSPTNSYTGSVTTRPQSPYFKLAGAKTHSSKYVQETYGKHAPSGTSPLQSFTYQESSSRIQQMLSADTTYGLFSPQR